MGIQTRHAMARLSEALHAKASCEEGFRHSRPGLAGVIGSWAPRRCSVVFSRGLGRVGSGGMDGDGGIFWGDTATITWNHM